MSESISPLPAVGEVFLDIERAYRTGAGDTYKGNGTVSVSELELNTALEELSVACEIKTIEVSITIVKF